MADNLNSHIKTCLKHLNSRPIHTITNPQRRASVAIVIRLKPPFPTPGTSGTSTPNPPPPPPFPATRRHPAKNNNNTERDEYTYCKPEDIDAVFEQSWTNDAVAEILFIKRTANVRDRWSGHVALPGGRRDKGDRGDEEAAVRECLEEVGLDLIGTDALMCGALPQRVIITNWGQKPLMVLSPFVFLLPTPTIPPLTLQASEVAAAFWIPLRFLLDGKHRSHHAVNVSDRMANSTSVHLKPFFEVMLGNMYFSAIHLMPEEVSRSRRRRQNHYVQNGGGGGGGEANEVDRLLTGTAADDKDIGELMLWGITFGVLADMLELLPPFDFVQSSWSYPSFSSWDYKLVVWAISWMYRRQRARELQSYKSDSGKGDASEEGIPASIDFLIKGYYPFVRRAVYITVIARLSLLVTIPYFALKYFKSV